MEFYFNSDRYRVTEGLNKIKDPKLKATTGEALLQSIKDDLAQGYNPKNPTGHLVQEKIKRTNLGEAIQIFVDYHILHKSRQKTISTYKSKLNALAAMYPDILISDITTEHLEEFLQVKINDGTFAQNSVKSAKRVFSAFFEVMLKKKYISSNPKSGIDSKIKSTKVVDDIHVPYTDEDMKLVMDYLDQNDKHCAFVCRMIYFTCIRPSEIRGLQIKHIDINNRVITIPLSVKKVTSTGKDDELDINDSFIPHLNNLGLHKYPEDYYLTGDFKNIIGTRRIGENTTYEHLMVALRALGLDKKSYGLYSFKHTSNIKKYLAGWSIRQIMKANRHTNEATTEVYLKGLGVRINIKDIPIPLI